MSIQAAIASHLIHDSRVALEVSSNKYPEPRVFHLVAPPRTRWPYITFEFIGGNNRTRYMTNRSGMVMCPMQLNCWGRSIASAFAVNEAVQAGLDHKHHTNIGRAPNTIFIRSAMCDDYWLDYEPPRDAGELGIFRYIQEWRITHTEALPELAV
jgi:hypothetical protein